MINPNSVLTQIDYDSHDPSTALIINHGCGHCFIPIDASRCRYLSTIYLGIEDCCCSGAIIFLVHNMYHGLYGVSCCYGHS